MFKATKHLGVERIREQEKTEVNFPNSVGHVHFFPSTKVISLTEHPGSNHYLNVKLLFIYFLVKQKKTIKNKKYIIR